MRTESLVRREWTCCVPICTIRVYIIHECIMKKDFVDIINDITYYYYIGIHTIVWKKI